MTHLVFGDVHFPFHSRKALIGLGASIRALDPDRVDVAGDLLDCTSLSSKFFDLPTDRRVWTIDTELTMARKFLALLREHCPHADIHLHEGNHESRLTRWLGHRGREIRGVVAPLPTLLGCEGLDIHWHSYGTLARVGGIAVTHGSVIRKDSGGSAKCQYQQYGCSLIMGHTHRGGSYYFTDATGTHTAYENFCLCDLKPHYVVGTPNWQQGWSVIYHSKKGAFHVEQVLWEGKTRQFFHHGRWCPGDNKAAGAAWVRGIPQPIRWRDQTAYVYETLKDPEGVRGRALQPRRRSP